ncbi:uncharacterized protein LOC101848843 [Aplysia californica]|uniref:Uncharacterized protein LOC101848843 n=1 Tax=Aplysia californica TaxID=6500 RepID=A0ABM1A925_APLCA|nr:uncharacterized protein LOC101848843 [Aplysia californica]
MAAMVPSKNLQLSSWVLVWFYVTAAVCTWDATFIMLRPYTLPGGSLAWFWYVYKYYVTVDQRYQDTKDAFVFAQSLLNYAEVVFNIITIVMHYRLSRHTTTTAFMVSVMTMWKTILYFLMFTEFCTGGVYRRGNTALQEFILVVLPNIVWVIIPLGVMAELWGCLTPQGQGQAAFKGVGVDNNSSNNSSNSSNSSNNKVNGVTSGHSYGATAKKAL